MSGRLKLLTLINEIPEIREAFNNAFFESVFGREGSGMSMLTSEIDYHHDVRFAWKQNEIDQYRRWKATKDTLIDDHSRRVQLRYQRQATRVRFPVGRSKK